MRRGEVTSRRGFVRALARTAAVGALAWLAIRLTGARRGAGGAGCTNTGPCAGCERFNHCRHPHAGVIPRRDRETSTRAPKRCRPLRRDR